MFYRPKEQLKAQLEERLRTALDFATLGAYSEGEASSSVSHVPVQDPPQRVFLFAKVQSPCPHGAAAGGRCTSDVVGRVAVTGGGSAIATRRRRRSRRGGAVKALPQPCTWASPPGS